ncbi:MAG: hypothetical protein WBC17_00140 [Mycobacterium sp.]
MKPPSWDDRYQGDAYVYDIAANEFLSSQVSSSAHPGSSRSAGGACASTAPR